MTLCIGRREFITLLGGAAAAWPLAARAQQPAMPVVGFLNGGSPDAFVPLRDGVSPRIERSRVMWTARTSRSNIAGPRASIDRLPAHGGRSGCAVRRGDRRIRCRRRTAAKARDHDHSDRLRHRLSIRSRLGLVASLNRPGGNVTGVHVFLIGAGGKAAGTAARAGAQRHASLGLLVNPTSPNAEASTKGYVAAAARDSGCKSRSSRRATTARSMMAFATLVATSRRALVGSDAFFTSRRVQLAHLTARHAIPAIYQLREFAEVGGLMSYGTSLTEALSAGWRLHRPHPQGRKACRPAGRAVDQVRVGHQPPDREGARHRRVRRRCSRVPTR